MKRFRHGLVVGKCYPPHAGHHRLIRIAAAACERVTVVIAPSRIESIPLDVRLDWLREVHADTPQVRFVGVYDDHPIDYADPLAWDVHCAVFRNAIAAIPVAVDVVFSSEAYGDELARRFAAHHVCVDPRRLGAPISGTAIRADPTGTRGWLAAPVRAWFTRRVVVIGAESTGTTTLADALGRHFRLRGGRFRDTAVVPEYGRTLTEQKLAAARSADATATVFDLTWDRADFRTVVAEQNAAEDRAARSMSPLLICDTDAFATAVWEDRYLGSASDEVRAGARRTTVRRPDLYLLTSDVGVQFVDDGIRDGEHVRSWMTDRFRAELRAAEVPWLELTGTFGQRLRAAVSACDDVLARPWQLAEPLRPLAEPALGRWRSPRPRAERRGR